MPILDSADVVATALKNYLISENLLNDARASEDTFLVSDYTESFELSARMFFHQSVQLVKHPLWE